MSKGEWSPDLYLKFKEQRTQPAKDLISKIDAFDPKRILDIGCGPGNSTRELKNKWDTAELIGIDTSEPMIKKAIDENKDISFIQKDAAVDISDLGMFDIIFSNAALQWIPGFPELVKRYYKMLNPDGIFAAQIPNVTGMHIQSAVNEVSARRRWNKDFKKLDTGISLYEPFEYYDMLASVTGLIDLWETWYYHVMPDHNSIIEWYSSTGMKPYLSCISEHEQKEFMKDVLEVINEKYTVQSDGSILFPFRRIFFSIKKI